MLSIHGLLLYAVFTREARTEAIFEPIYAFAVWHLHLYFSAT
jgi:hypothetical protein